MKKMKKGFYIGLVGFVTLGMIAMAGQSSSQQVEEQAKAKQNISLETAKNIALQEIPGVIEQAYIEDDEYTIVITKDGKTYEVEMTKEGKIKEKEGAQSTTTLIDEEKAKEIALQKVNGQVLNVDKEKDEYEFRIQKDNMIYEVEVDNQSGKILHIEKEPVEVDKNLTLEQAKALALQKVNGKIVKVKTEKDGYEIQVQKENMLYEMDIDKKLGKITSIDKEPIEINKNISLEQAKEIALQKVNGKIIDVKTSQEDYEVHVQKGNLLYEIEIEKKSGKMTSMEKEALEPIAKVSKDQAKSIALQKVNGQVTSIELEDNRYFVDITKDNEEYELQIDAQSGQILKTEKDS